MVLKEEKNKEEKIKLIVKNNIRKALKGKIANVAEEVEEALNNKVHEILLEGVKRAEANQRKTLHARDL